MNRIKVRHLLGCIFFWLATITAQAQTVQTNLAVIVRHAPSLNGNARIDGSLQQLLGENTTLNGGATLTGDLLAPGTPTLVLNGNPAFSGTIAGSGSTSPSGYQVMLNGNCSLHYLRTRTTPVSLPTVSVPPSPTGTRNVTINGAGQSYGDAATLRDLALNGNVGMISVPPGTYGNFTVNGGSGLVLGVAGGLQAVNYNLQNLTLNGHSTLKVVGPVILTVANGFTANGNVGSSNNPAWLQLKIANGDFTINGGCTVCGLVLAPNGTVTVNGNSTLVGTSASDKFTLNGGGLVRWAGVSTQTNPPPVATPQSITLAENSSTNITLAGSDPQGKTLTFTLLTQPSHGTVSGAPPNLTYQPATNYFGSDAFTFKVNNGITDSLPAAVSLTITQVYYPPTAFAQSLTNFEDTALPVTLTGYDPQGYALTFSVLTQPAHGTLSGTTPHLTYQPATNYFGNDSFTFQVDDGVSNSLAATISITNQPVDDPPMVVAGPDQLIILPANSVSLAGSVIYDAFPGTVDTVVWSEVSGPGTVTFSNPSNELTTATFSQSGIYQLRLYASDSFLSGSSDLFITVDAPPVVNAGQAMTNTFPGTIILQGSASDDGLPTNGVLTVVWSEVSRPGTVVFGNAATTNSTATFSTNGVYVLRLTADDSIATNHSDVTVIENMPPVINSGTSILTNGLQTALNGSVTDDGLPGAFLSWQWSQSTGPGTITFGDASATNTTVTASQSGTYVLVLTATDGAATNSGEVAVTFNLPPVVNAGPEQAVNFGDTVTLAGMGTDDQLPYNTLTNTWSQVSGPGNTTFADVMLTNTTVTFDQPGIYTLRLTADDGLATTSADVVIKVNAAPVVDAGTNQLVILGTPVALAGSYTDDGISGSPVTTLWTQISGPVDVVFTDPTAASTTVNFSQSGVYVFELTANDGMTNGSAQVTVTVDQAPMVTAVSPFLMNWPANQVMLRGTVSDDGLPPGAELTSTWSQISGPGVVSFSMPIQVNSLAGIAIINQVTTSATFSQPGVYVLRLNADDSFAASSASVTISLNQAPVVNAGRAQTNNFGTPILLNGTVTDDGLPVGAPVTAMWSQVSGPGTLSFANIHLTNTTVTASVGGIYTLQLTADDTMATNSGIVTIKFNLPPVAQSQTFTIQQGQSLPLALTGSDPDGDSIAFAVVGNPVSGALTGTPPNLVYTPNAAFYGQDSFTFVANDGMATSAVAPINITVTPTPRSRTYTTDADFNEGQYSRSTIQVTNDEVILRSKLAAFHNLWVANSTKGTIIRIDTDTGEIKGEYKSAPDGEPLNPSRTTVDLDGSVWAANRDGNSVVHISVPEAGLWVDRNTNGILDTSTNLGDVRPWPNTNHVDSNGGVSSAQDELIMHYVKVRSGGTRHVSVDANNDVWVSGTLGRFWDLIDGSTGKIIRQEPSVGYGGYGGLIDRKGVIWSSNPLMRWDTSEPLSGTNWLGYSVPSYGIGLDSKGNVWVSTLNSSGQIRKIAPDGTIVGTFYQGSPNAQGVAVGLDDDVWVASSLLGGTTVGHLKNDGTFVGNVKVGQGPTGVAVDYNGKIWVAHYNSGNVMRIDPYAGPIGADGQTPVGQVDYTSPYLGGNLYNYSDMTGSTLIGFPGNGTWNVVYDSTITHAQWGPVAWNCKIYDDGKLQVAFSTSDDGTNFGPAEILSQPNMAPASLGRYAKVVVTFIRSASGQGPELYDLTLGTLGYNAPVVQPAVNVDAGPDRDLQLPLTAALHAAIWHNGFYTYNTNQSFAWSMVSGPGTAIFGNPNAATTSAQFSNRGVYDVRVQTTLLGTVYSDDVNINAIPINRPPWVDVGPNRVLRSTNDVLYVAATATDDGLPAGSVLTVQWSKIIGPGTVTFSNPNSTTNNITFSAPGIYHLQLSASDGQLSYAAQLEVRVQCPCEVEAPSGIAQWWSGNADTHESIRGNDMHLYNGAGYAPAQISYGFYFNGTSNYAKAYAHPAMDIGSSDSMTIEFWAKASSSSQSRFFDWYRNGIYGIYADYNNGTLTFHLLDTNHVDHSFSVGSALNTSQFQHVALTYDKTTGTAVVYVNGIVVSTQSPGSFTPDTTEDFYLAGGPQDSSHFGGIVDELSMYNRALTGEEIYEIFSAQFIGKCPVDSDLPPVVNAGGPVSVPSPGSTLTLNGSVTDDGLPPGVPLYSEWRTVDGPTNVIFGNSNSPVTTATFPLPGLYTLQLYADDGEKSATDQAEARVNASCNIKGPSGLVAWWPGNNSDADIMGGNPAMRFNGASFTNGLVEGCFKFDGINDYCRVSTLSSYNVGASAAGFTVEYWMKPNSQESGSVLGWANGVRIERYSAFNVGGIGLRCYLSGTGSGQTVDAGAVLASSGWGWTHVAVTYDRTSGQAKMYINGAQSGATVTVGTNLMSTAGDFFLGQVSPSGAYFSGQLDEVSLYQRPLNPEEIYNIYASGSVGKCPNDANQPPVVYAGPDLFVRGVPGTATLNGQASDDGLPAGSTLRVQWSKFSGPGTVTFNNPNSAVTPATFSTNGIYVLQLTADDGEAQSHDLVEVRVESLCTVEDPQGLAAWWPGNGTSVDVLNGYDAILGSGANYAPGEVASAFNFDGANDYVWMLAETNYNVGASTAGFTVEYWMKPNSQESGSVLGWANGVRFERYSAFNVGGIGLRCYLSGTGSGQLVDAGAVLASSGWGWTHVAVTYDRTSGLSKIYINGVLSGTATVGTNLLSTAGDFYLGQVPGSASYFSGQLDEVSLYQRPLNPEEINNIYASGSVGKCPNDNNQPPVVYAGPDLFVRGVPGTATLNGQASDDGLPSGSTLRVQWSQFSGPGTATFNNPNSAVTPATFSTNGIYVLQLTADDGEAQSHDLVEVRVESLCTVEDPQGLAAWWPGNGSDVDVINGYDAIQGSGSGYAPGEVASAFNFDGANDYVWMPAQTNYNVGASAAGFTVEYWMKPNSQESGSVLGWANGVRVERYSAFNVGGIGLRCYLSGTGSGQTVDAGAVVPSSGWGWMHVAVTYDRTSGLSKIYINGVLSGTATVGTNLLSTAGDFYLGQVSPSGAYFSGQLDEVSLYRRPLNPEEINNIYASGSVGKCPNDANQPPVVYAGPDFSLSSTNNVGTLNGVVTDDGLPAGSTLRIQWSVYNGPGSVTFANSNAAATTATFSTNGIYVLRLTADDGEAQSSDLAEVRVGTPCVVQDIPGLSAWWPANGTSKDKIGGLNAILGNGTSYTNGKVAAAFNFDGANDYAWMPAQTNYNVGSSPTGFTVEYWMKPSAQQDGSVLGWANGVRVERYGIYNTVGGIGLRCYLTGSGQTVDAGWVLASSGWGWTHVAVTYDRTTGQAKMYINGAQSGGTATVGTNLLSTAGDFYLGQVPGSANYYAGELDEVSLYTRPLAQSEIQAIYNAGSAGKCITPPNQPPVVIAGANQTIHFPTNTVTLNGTVFDEGLPFNTLAIAWTYLSGPGTVYFNSTNTAVTTVTFPVAPQPGEGGTNTGVYTFQLSASDGQYTVSNTVTVTVLPDTRPRPVVTITSPADGTLIQAPAGGTASFNLAAAVSDTNGRVLSVEFFLNGASVGVCTNAPYALTASSLPPATYTITAVATDYDGLSTTSAPVTATIYVDTGAPTVELFTPEDSAVITAPTAVVGTVISPILQSYQLQYRLKNPDDATPAPWTVLATGSASVVSNALGTIDPTMMLNGLYELQLVATDLENRTASTAIQTFSVERNLKIGNFTLSFQDLNVPVSGIPIQIVRTYDSRDLRTNDFGVGWSMDIRNIRLQKTRSLGPNWYQYDYPYVWPGFPIAIDTYSLDPINPREITVTMAGDKVYHFQAVLSPDKNPGAPIEDVFMTFTNKPGTYGGLAIDGDNEALLPGNLGYVNLISYSDFISDFNPTRFRFTNELGDVYIIDEKEGLKSLTDRNQNTLIIATNGIIWTNAITHNSGVGVSFVRDDQGRIAQIIDPAGNALNYTYSTNGSLASFTDRATNTTSFAYTNAIFPHYLTGITDPRGNQAIRTVYDDSGRMIQQIDADGNVINFNHDFSNQREEITDRLGHTTINYYDDDGNVVATIDALGNVTTHKYDQFDNEIEKVDALGNTNSWTYDGSGNKLSETDPLGFTTSYTYGPYRQLNTVTTPRGYTTTNVYDPASGVLTQESDPLGNVTTYSYDFGGNLLTRADALGNVISNSYDGSGHVTSTTTIDAQRGVLNSSSFAYDANGNRLTKTTTRTTPHGIETLVTAYAYDENNRLVQTINPDGSTNATIYAVGLNKPAAEIDPLGHQTLHFYDERGNETNIVFADLTRESTAYDSENRKISSTDRAGRITFYTNDALGRLTATRMPDGAVVQTVYDADGRAIITTDANGNSTFYGFDADGRNTSVTNALGQVSSFEYNQSGNRTAMIDAGGRTNRVIYDALDRCVQSIFADGMKTVTTYDAAGRRIAETDQNTNTIWFTYDARRRLVAVTNALGKVTTYGYDEVGNLVTQTDANNHATTFEYDSMGRRLKRTLPGNQVETYAYDLAGNLTNKVDFNGHVTCYSYDSVNRLLTKTPDAAFNAPPVTMTYTATGQRAMMSDASGKTTYYYNSRDWLTNKAARFYIPGGARYTSVLSYSYDAHGNVTHISSSDPNGVDVGYNYDALNRLENVNDAQTGTTTYGYDDVGNLAGYVYPNNVSSTYAYDSLNRLTNLTTLNYQLSTVAYYNYTVAAGGQRLTANENVMMTNGIRTINRLYTYDATYRLTHEGFSVTDPVTFSTAADVGYTLDDVGNRLSRLSTLNQLPSTASTFDANDRLNSDTYDANGNTAVGRESTRAVLSSGYDFEDRLVTATNAGGSVINLTYDGDGNRVSKTVGGVTTLYLVDDQNPSGYAQVLEEQTTTGGTPAVTRVYAYGHTLISQTFEPSTLNSQPSTFFYGYDGHNNVRYLTDTTGNVTDTYDYDAFGMLVAQSSIFQLPTPNSYLYCGEQFDSDLGLYYNRARYLNPDTGRFWSMDTYEGENHDPGSLHKYLYCKSDPVNKIDPSGNWLLVEEMCADTAALGGRATEIEIKLPTIGQAVTVALLAILAWEVVDVVPDAITQIKQRERENKHPYFRYDIRPGLTSFGPGTDVTSVGTLDWSQAISITYFVGVDTLYMYTLMCNSADVDPHPDGPTVMGVPQYQLVNTVSAPDVILTRIITKPNTSYGGPF